MNAGPAAAAPETSDTEQREEQELLAALKHATLGEYDIYSMLGRGGMAAVFRAMELSLNRWVAIKVISPSALSSSTVIDRFWLEARTAASLSHPNIIPIFAVRAIEGLHFFVMKHVQGGSLDTVLKAEGPLPVQVVRTVLTQVAGALAYAHRRGVIHRDIKPANIMLDEEGYAIVMDFGIAKVRDVAALTASGAMVGTPYYMSPEQFNGQQVDGRSDQYSLGCVAFELLTGVRPFKGDTVPAVLRGHLLDKAPDVRSLRPDCPTSLATLISRMLCKTPTDRFASMEVLYGQLESMPRMNADAMRDKITSLAKTASQSNPQLNEPQSPIPLSRTSTAPLAPEKTADNPQRSSLSSLSTIARRRPWVTAAIVLVGLISVVVARQSLSSGNVPSKSFVTRSLSDSTSRNTEAGTETTVPVKGNTQEGRVDTSSRVSTVSGITPGVDANSNALGLEKSRAPEKHSISEQGLSQTGQPGSASARATPNKGGFPQVVPTQQPSRLSINESTQSAPGLNSFAPLQTEPPPLPTPLRPQPAIRIGSRIPAAFLYMDGQQVGLIRGLHTFTHAAGQVHLQIRADDCLTWDSVITVSEGDTARIGFRNPVCTK